MSGAQWSAERLNELAADLLVIGTNIGRAQRDEIAVSLLAFASVVSVLEHAPVKVLRYGEAWEAFAEEPGYRQFGDTPLAAILALSEALDG